MLKISEIIKDLLLWSFVFPLLGSIPAIIIASIFHIKSNTAIASIAIGILVTFLLIKKLINNKKERKNEQFTQRIFTASL